LPIRFLDVASPELPDLSAAEFSRRLSAVSPRPLAREALSALFAHYQELRRWNRTISLVGPGTVEDLMGRHYGESLAALPLLSVNCRRLLDLGSGAGFPGLVLAAALPASEATLVEARERKAAFLTAAARRAALSLRCLNARVGPSLPAGLPQQVDLLTARAVKLPSALLAALAERLSPGGQILLWVGEETPEPPPAWERGEERRLPGSARRRIIELRRSDG
jgi:16S rRNA (guanine527-N7)-methyltransferase